MRVLLDEHLPVDLALELAGHDVDTVVGRGWAGIKNGDLLRRMSGDYDVLITMDRGIEFQQPIAGFPFGVVIAHAASNRLQHLIWLCQTAATPAPARCPLCVRSESRWAD